MLEIKSFGSGSAGNCYTISDGENTIMLEAGLPIKEIKKAMDYQVSKLSGVLLSHGHGDHAKSIKDVARLGVTCFMSAGTKKELELDHHRLQAVKPLQAFEVGGFKVLPFPVEHDTDEPFGYLIQAKSGEKILFATDTYYIRYKFKGLTHIMVEANFSESILDEQIRNGITNKSMKRRLMRSHFSLENVITFLRANDLAAVEEIWLLHLSDSNSNAAQFKREIAELTGKMIVIP